MAADDPLLVLGGPTAVGKSRLALRWAERVGAEIIAADSATVYRGLEIGNAKPTAADRARVPHHLLDVVGPADHFTVARFQELAQRAVGEIRARGHLVLVVGGTGLWIRSLTEGFVFPPVRQPGWDAEVARWQRERGLAAVRRQLRIVDPAGYEGTAAGDARRIRRALAAYLGTGRQLARNAPTPRPSLKVALTRSPEHLNDRIARRAQQQLADGLQQEVLHWLSRGLSPGAQALQALGYRETVAWARGLLPEADLLALIVRHTRQYAKRQRTWFRHEPGVRWINLDEVDEEGAVAQLVRWTAEVTGRTPAGRW